MLSGILLPLSWCDGQPAVGCRALLGGTAESRIVGGVGDEVLGSWRERSCILVELRVEQKRLHVCPASSFAIKRIFSNFTHGCRLNAVTF